uniref:Nucleoporin_C domain-containing protein n=1 Tax=Echinostoma caproni TaxID=27848 RepID=A0A183B5I7_9TREM
LGTSPCSAAGDTGAQSSMPVDKSLATGLFLFSGLCVFLARIGRTFWRSPLFRDASAVTGLTGGSGQAGTVGSKGLSSWMRRFVHTLATASPLGAGGRSKLPSEQPIISRLDPEEIGWLMQQIAYAQQFLRRQLDVRGGWLRANQITSVPRSAPLRMGSGDGVEHLDTVLLQRLAEELDQLLSLVLELLGLWRVISEHVVHRVVRCLTPDQRRSILHVPFEAYAINLLDLVSPARAFTSNVLSPSLPPSPTVSPTLIKTPVLCDVDLITALINALIEYYLTEASQDVDSGINLDGITSRLQTVCPTLFANEDAISAKASECLIQASLLRASYLANGPGPTDDVSNLTSDEAVQVEIDQLVQQALSLYTEAGPSLDLENAVQRLEAAGAWRGAIALCLTVALKRDPANVAVDCLKTGRRPSADPPLTGPQAQLGRRLNPRCARSGALSQAATTELAATEGRYDAYHRLVSCLERLYEWSRIAPRSANLATKQSQPGSPEQSLLQSEVAQTVGGLSAVYLTQPDTSPATARSVLHAALRDIMKSDDILAHFEVGHLYKARLVGGIGRSRS